MGNFKDENFEVKVPNTDFILKANKTYRIIGKKDTSAPDGFQERGITKFEHPLNGEGAIVHYSKDRKLWDTGLYENSPCYAKMSSDDINKTVKTLNDGLVSYLEEVFPEGVLKDRKGSNTYWDEYSFPLNQNFTIATNTPEAFFGLWIAILHGHVAPEVNQKAPRYRELSTPYVIIDSAEKTSNKQKYDFAKSRATAKFINSLEDNRTFLIEVLNYVKFRASEGTSDSILNSMFKQWIDNKKDGGKNAVSFVEAYDNFNSEEGKEELEVYKMLNKGIKNNKITYSRSEYFIGEESIGANIKKAAKKINKNDKLKGELVKLMN